MPAFMGQQSSHAGKRSSMAGETRAVIDVGTNSVKLLVADVEKGLVRPLHEASHQTRLGHGFYETHILQEGAIEQTAKAVAEFREEAERWNTSVFRVIATSAARDALNKEALLGALSRAAGVTVEVISGEQEADWAYKGVTSDPQLAGEDLLVMDVGGGSTEFILGRGSKRLYAESFPVGSVRLLQKVELSDPPTERERIACEKEVRAVLEDRVKPHLEKHLRELGGEVQLVTTGGTSTILARVKLKLRSFSREMIEGTFLSREEVRAEIIRLWNMPLHARKQVIGLPPNRADVILPGIVIFHEVMELFGLETMRVSTRGLRFAALMD